MKITELSVKYPAAIAVILGLLFLFGWISIGKLPLQLLPDILQPQITIYNNWRSAAPQEVEEAIVQPQEELLRSNSGLKTITSNTNRGQGVVNLTYQLGYDMKRALLEVINRLNQAPPLPVDAGEPFVSSGSDGGLPGAASVLVYPREGNNIKDLTVYQGLIDEVVEPRLSRISGVAQVNIRRRPLEINIVLNPLKAAMLGIQTRDINQALNRSRDVSGGFADVGRRRYTVRFIGEEEIPALGEVVVGWRNSQPVYLREIAEIKIEPAESNSVTLRNGNPAFYISISRRNEANTVQLLDELNEAIKDLNRGRLKEAGLIIELSFDASLHIRRAISLVEGNLLLGIFMATLVLFFFLRNLRATLLITLTVPVSLMVAFISLAVFDLTLNVISLAGLAFAVGLVMDAAIVVQENSFRLRQTGMKLSDAILEGSRQVGGALFSSTVTTVAIFLPVLFLLGVEGQLIKDLAITLSVAVIASMLTALTVLPAITSRWLNVKIPEDQLSHLWDKLTRLVINTTETQRVRLGWILGTLGISVLCVYLLTPKVDLLPRANIDGIQVFFRIPAGMNFKTIDEELGKEVVKRLKPYYDGEKLPGIKSYNFASFGGFYTQVYIYPKEPGSTGELIEKLRSEIFIGIPDVQAFVSQGSMINLGNGGGRNISVDIQGTELTSLLAAAEEGQKVIEGLWENVNVRASGGLSLDEPELRIFPDDRRINAAGLDRASVANLVRAFTGGLFAGEYFDGNERLDMMIRTEKWQSPEELLAIPVATPLAGVQKLGDLVKVERAVGPTRLTRVDGKRTLTLNVLPPEEVTLEEALEKLEAFATPAIKAKLPPGGSVHYRGNADRLRLALDEMLSNFVLAIAILFMIMAALFKSLKDSLFVLLVMPLAMAGGLMGLSILNLASYQSLDMLTLIGFIILLGLVVNNAILLVDQTRRAQAAGLDLTSAVSQAVRFRARPVFMSSLTSIFGMMPLMLIPGVGSEIYRGLATVIVGGMTVSLLFTLFLLPSLLRLELHKFNLPLWMVPERI